MLSINWIITDNLAEISVEEFDNEWNGIIAGYFELCINEEKEGFCPERKIEEDEEGLEDILFWLSHLFVGLSKVKKGETYEMPLLTMNVYKLVLKFKEKVEFQFVNELTNEAKWIETVEMQEFENELMNSINKFKNEIQNVNPKLFNSKWIKKLDMYQ